MDSAIREQIEHSQDRLRDLERTWPVPLLPLPSESTPADSVLNAFPLLFVAAFPPVPAAPLRELCLAVRLLSLCLLAADDLIDGEIEASETAPRTLRILALQLEADRAFAAVFAAGSPFWPAYSDLMAEHARATLAELRLVRGEIPWSGCTADDVLALAAAKNRPFRLPVLGLAALTGEQDPVAGLCASLDAYAVSLQMYDDVRDWRRDLARGQPSLLLLRAVGERPDRVAAARPDFQREVLRAICYGGHSRHVLGLALDAAERADRLAAPFAVTPWRDMLAFHRAQCRSLLADLERIVEANRRRAARQAALRWRRPPAAEGWLALACDALEPVLVQWRLGFGEARHIVSTGEPDPATGVRTFQHVDVFQRALLADILCDAAEHLGVALRPAVDREADYLLSRHADAACGWGYFPDLPDRPCDADSLGQILQVLLRAGRHAEVIRRAEPPLAILLRDNAHPDGSFDTWIIPAANRTPLQGLQAAHARAWGGDRANEVVANLLYALTLWDPPRFRLPLERGADFLVARQQADGSWPSAWYLGPFYGTYVCARLLAAVRPGSGALEGAARFLLRAQRPGGGWGLDGGGDPLSTALALLALACLRDTASTGVAAAAAAARAYLAGRREGDGAWAAAPFILLPPLGAYGSRTMTTAFVLKSALAWLPEAVRTGPAAP